MRRRVLAWRGRRGYLDAETLAAMRAWQHTGDFLLDASVRLFAWQWIGGSCYEFSYTPPAIANGDGIDSQGFPTSCAVVPTDAKPLSVNKRLYR